MDIDTDSSVSKLMKDAAKRTDGRAMYLSLGILFVGAIVFSVRNVIASDFSFPAWKVVLASALMLPTEVLLYFFLAAMGITNVRFSRILTSVCLLFVPIYLFAKLS